MVVSLNVFRMLLFVEMKFVTVKFAQVKFTEVKVCLHSTEDSFAND